MKNRDLFIILAVIVIATIAAIFLWPKAKGNIAEVWYNGEVVTEIPLADDGIYTIDANLPVTLEVKDQKIRYIHAHCPDKLCEHVGWICNATETAICMPAGVVVLIKEKN